MWYRVRVAIQREVHCTPPNNRTRATPHTLPHPATPVPHPTPCHTLPHTSQAHDALEPNPNLALTTEPNPN